MSLGDPSMCSSSLGLELGLVLPQAFGDIPSGTWLLMHVIELHLVPGGSCSPVHGALEVGAADEGGKFLDIPMNV